MRTIYENIENTTIIPNNPFSGGDPPPIYPLRGVWPTPYFYMMKYHPIEELCKKLEVPISKNIAAILQKPIFRGGTPPIYPLRVKNHGATSVFM